MHTKDLSEGSTHKRDLGKKPTTRQKRPTRETDIINAKK